VFFASFALRASRFVIFGHLRVFAFQTLAVARNLAPRPRLGHSLTAGAAKGYTCTSTTLEGSGSMARKKTQRRDWRMTVFLAISLIIIVSMVLGSVIMSINPN
jgi:hypothetical protein